MVWPEGMHFKVFPLFLLSRTHKNIQSPDLVSPEQLRCCDIVGRILPIRLEALEDPCPPL